MLRDPVGYRGPIVSYEPISELAAELGTLSSIDPDWHIVELALDREDGPAIFHVMADSQFSSLHHPAIDQPAIFTVGNSIAREVTVTRATIGAELPKWRDRLGFTRPFLKMDAQGNDFAVGRVPATPSGPSSSCKANWHSTSFMTTPGTLPPVSLLSPHAVLISVPSSPTMRGTSRRSLKSTA
jgi:hypothetical protein